MQLVTLTERSFAWGRAVGAMTALWFALCAASSTVPIFWGSLYSPIGMRETLLGAAGIVAVSFGAWLFLGRNKSFRRHVWIYRNGDVATALFDQVACWRCNDIRFVMFGKSGWLDRLSYRCRSLHQKPRTEEPAREAELYRLRIATEHLQTLYLDGFDAWINLTPDEAKCLRDQLSAIPSLSVRLGTRPKSGRLPD